MTGHEYLGRKTNNQAEYYGLLLGLNMAIKLGVKRLSIQGDSRLVLEQLKDLWKVKNHDLKPLHSEAKKLLENFDISSIDHIPRSRNSDADSFANEAVEARTKAVYSLYDNF